MLEMMNGSKDFIDKMEAETRKGPVVVSTTRSRQQERQPDGTETPKMVVDDRKSQGRHVVKIRVNVGSPEGVVASGEDELQSASNGQVTPLTQVKVLTDGLNDLELFSKPLVIGRTLKHVEKREVMIEEEKESRRLEEREEDQMYKPTLPGQVDRVKEAATVGSFLISSTGTTSSEIKNKLKQSGLHQQNLPEMRPSNQSTSNTVRINVSSAPVETTMFSRNDEESTPYYSYNQLAYLYSHSGQSSPASDSGTCSDFDANTPPPLPKKKSSMIKKVSTIQLNVGNISKDHILSPHKGTTSLMSSSGDAESDDDISCDSLNSSELEHQVVSSSSSTSSDHLTSSHHITDDLHHLDELDEEDVDDGVHDVLSRRRMVQEFGKQKSVPPPLPPKKNHQKKILENRPPVETTTSSSNGLSSVETSITTIKDNKSLKTVSHPEVSRQVSVEERDRKHPKTVINPQVSRQVSVEERTYDQRNRVTSPNSTLERSDSSIYDSFYKFHLNENSDLNSVTSAEDCNSLSSTATMKSSVTVDGLDSFAGRKGYIQDGDVENATIRSSKGTIRGVKNRVRAGIATFLQMHSNKRWEEKEAGKVVVYTTTMGTVRETYLRCLKVRQIMRTNLVKFEERDAFMSREVQAEIKERMSSEVVALPQVFVEGQHLGDAETVERLNESGELRRILQPYKSPDACITCQVCGGYRLLPCGVCNGSKKSVHRNHFTTELVALKCMNCDEVGLVRCYAC